MTLPGDIAASTVLEPVAEIRDRAGDVVARAKVSWRVAPMSRDR